MTPQYIHTELWDAAKCARLLGFKNPSAFRYAVSVKRMPEPVARSGNSALWRAQDIREVFARKKAAALAA